MTQLFVNNFSATVTQTFGSADTFLYVNTVAGLPALTGGNYLLLTLFRKTGVVESGHEVVKVTAITDLMLTVERAVEGAAASLFNVGAFVEARVTAGALAAKADVADAYVHPANHPASIITQDASNRFVTDAEKASWDAKQPAGNYATGGGTATGTNTGDQDLSGYATLTGVQTLTNKTLTAPTVAGAILNDGYTEEVFAVTGTTPAISPTNGSIQTWTLSANSTPTAGTWADGQSLILGITASSFSVTWFSATWSKVGGSGAAPALTSTGVNWIILWRVGGTIRASFLGTA